MHSIAETHQSTPSQIVSDRDVPDPFEDFGLSEGDWERLFSIADGRDVSSSPTSPSNHQNRVGYKHATTNNPISNLTSNQPDMPLPGTASGQGGAGLNTIEQDDHQDEGVVSVPRTMLYSEWFHRVFKKAHKILTFGIATTTIEKAIPEPGTGKNYFLTSALASLPVHRIPFYMNQQEYFLLQPGEEVTLLKVKIIQRNVRIAFEAGGSTNHLATLNQNKNIQYAVGLNKTGIGLDSKYSAFVATEPMIPTDVDTAQWLNLGTALYGEEQTSAQFTTSLPLNAFGGYYIAPNYWTTASHSSYRGGWPNVISHITTKNAAATQDKVLLEYTYEPGFAPLINSVNYRGIGNPYRGEGLAIGMGTAPYYPNTMLITNAVSTATPRPPAECSWAAGNNDNYQRARNSRFAYTARIERSQELGRGLRNAIQAKAQPSLHIGIEAIPALTTSSIGGGEPLHYTDAQAYFDVEVEMHTKFRNRAARQYGTVSDIDFEDQIFETMPTTTQPNDASSCFMGLLTTNIAN